MKNKEIIILLIVAILVEIIGILSNSLKGMFWGIMLLWLLIIIYSNKDLKKRLILLIFDIAFFNFMLGKIIINLILEDKILNEFSYNTNYTTLLLIFLSLFSVLIGNIIFEKIGLRKEKNIENTSKQKIIRNISKHLFIFSLIMAFLSSIEQALFVSQNGYLSLYINFSSKLPSIVSKIGNMSLLLFFIYLYTFPPKKEAYFAIIAYLSYTIVNLLTGDRSEFVIIILLLIIYLYYRQKELDEIFFTKRIKVSFFLISFLLIAFLGNYNYARNNIEGNRNGLFGNILLFFEDQGGSFKIIPYTIINKNKLEQMNSHYATGPLINYIKYGSISSIIGEKKEIMKNNTIQMAENGNNLGASLTYLVNKNYYLSGGGLGTEYIAELFIEFGYMGVILYNILVGYMLGFVFNLSKNRYFALAIGTVIVHYLLFLPRDFAFNWIVNLFSIPNLLAIIILNIIANTLKKKGYKNERTNKGFMDS